MADDGTRFKVKRLMLGVLVVWLAVFAATAQARPSRSATAAYSSARRVWKGAVYGRGPCAPALPHSPAARGSGGVQRASSAARDLSREGMRLLLVGFAISRCSRRRTQRPGRWKKAAPTRNTSTAFFTRRACISARRVSARSSVSRAHSEPRRSGMPLGVQRGNVVWLRRSRRTASGLRRLEPRSVDRVRQQLDARAGPVRSAMSRATSMGSAYVP